MSPSICVFLRLCLQNVPPDLAICAFILEQSLSVRALQEMLANTVDMSEVRVSMKEREREREGWRGGEQVEIQKAEGQKEKE